MAFPRRLHRRLLRPLIASLSLFIQMSDPTTCGTPKLRDVPPNDKMSQLALAACKYVETEGSHVIVVVNVKRISQQPPRFCEDMRQDRIGRYLLV